MSASALIFISTIYLLAGYFIVQNWEKPYPLDRLDIIVVLIWPVVFCVRQYVNLSAWIHRRKALK